MSDDFYGLISMSIIDDIADAIRAKTGGSGKIKPINMATQISAIDGSGREDVSWHQCPESVRNYIANVSYNSLDYSTTQVNSYAPNTPAPATNTKPVGKTVDGVTFYNDIPNSDTPYATQNKAGALNPLDQVRWINTVSNNFRDLGGWACDGGTVKYGLLYRSADLNSNDADLLINQLGIKTEIDLTADGTPAYPGKMRFICHPTYAMYTLSNPGAWRTNLRGVFDAVIYGDPVVFHCSMGADRTGTLACVLEGLLGVSQSDIDKDYELTSFYAIRARNGNYQGGTQDWAHLIGEINAKSGSTFRDKCVSFVMSLGFTADEINAYRKAMIDGTPETLTPTVTTLTVTKTLTGCTIDNSASTVNENSIYDAVITPTGTNVLKSFDITMGGVSIKNSVYVEQTFPASRGIIHIENVTGDLVITATAEAAFENQIPISTDAQGNVYNTTGYKGGYRLNSSGAEAELTGYAVTGFVPFTQGQRIYLDKFDGTETSNGGIWFFKSDHTFIASYRVNRMLADEVLTAGQPISITPGTTIYDSGAGAIKNIEQSAYIRFSVKTSQPGSLVCGIFNS